MTLQRLAELLDTSPTAAAGYLRRGEATLRRVARGNVEVTKARRAR